MGRRTFESLGKPLSGRRNIVLTHDARSSLPGCEMARDADEAIALAGNDELFVIGGASVYKLFLPLASRLYITYVEGNFSGDVFFPHVRWENWRIAQESSGSPQPPGAPAHRFVDYQRIR
jgi:dihydrofolate reductase